jgi:hypothetical protein
VAICVSKPAATTFAAWSPSCAGTERGTRGAECAHPQPRPQPKLLPTTFDALEPASPPCTNLRGWRC